MVEQLAEYNVTIQLGNGELTNVVLALPFYTDKLSAFNQSRTNVRAKQPVIGDDQGIQ